VAYQHTLIKSVSVTGVGLHTGDEITLTLRPADAYDGIVFHRTDVTPGSGAVAVCASAVTDTQLCSKLTNEYGVEVGTVEHLMAALYALQIDNVLIELDGPEVPILDGSSLPFIEMIDKAGKQAQDEARKSIKILKEVMVKEGSSAVSVKPSQAFSLHVFVDYGYQIPPQKDDYTADEISFRSQLAGARTFCFEKDVEQMQSMGLAKGGNLENSVVYGEKGPINAGGNKFLRYKDEALRHKALDCVGDLYMAGYPLIGAFNMTRPGHEMNNRLLRAILENKENWKWV